MFAKDKQDENTKHSLPKGVKIIEKPQFKYKILHFSGFNDSDATDSFLSYIGKLYPLTIIPFTSFISGNASCYVSAWLSEEQYTALSNLTALFEGITVTAE